MIEEDSVVTTAEGLATADLGEEAVIFDAEAGVYYGLNRVGASILKLIEQPKSVRDVIEALLQEYEVSADQLRRDIPALLEEMQKQGLVRVSRNRHR